MKKIREKIFNWMSIAKNRQLLIKINHGLLTVLVVVVSLSAIISFFQKRNEVALWKLFTCLWILSTIGAEKQMEKMREIAIKSTEDLSILLEGLKNSGILVFKEIIHKGKLVN